MKEYKNTQIGYLLIVALGAATLLIGYLNIVTRFQPRNVAPPDLYNLMPGTICHIDHSREWSGSRYPIRNSVDSAGTSLSRMLRNTALLPIPGITAGESI